jgi:hypothetical protein
MGETHHVPQGDLESGLGAVRESPRNEGSLELIVARPEVDVREVLAGGFLDQVDGLVGDSWNRRPSSRTPDGKPHPDMQLNLINSRLVALISPDEDRRALAGDQLHVDLDLSTDNLPAGTRLAIGESVIEVTEQPHTGCRKFAARFGVEALAFISTPVGKALRLRGLNAKVVVPGAIRRGDVVRKL